MTRIRQHDHEAGDLRRGRHERRHRRRRALVDVRRPHVERRGGDLEREPREDHRHPGHEERVVGAGRLADRREPELAGRAVDERAAEQQDPRAEAPDDQVLEARLERRAPVRVERAQHVESDREPLERQEHRHQVRRGDEEDHPGARRGEERVVLADVRAAPVARREEHDREPDSAIRIAASAPSRSRVIDSTTTAVGSGERSKTQPASTADAPKPATETAIEKPARPPAARAPRRAA